MSSSTRRSAAHAPVLPPTTFSTPVFGNGASNAAETAQVFSTEFVSAMHVDDSAILKSAKIIEDAWKQKYNDPIQVPSQQTFDRGRREPRLIKPPEARTGFKRKASYYKQQMTDWDILQCEESHLELDEQDLQWLRLLNESKGTKAPLLPGVMAHLLWTFERQSCMGMLAALTQSPQSDAAHAEEEERFCDVCLLPDREDDNEMVFCDGCDTLVHQRCYGIAQVPEGDWFCAVCVAKKRNPKTVVTCALCPRAGGALKPTETPADRAWCHVQCAMWVPETLFGSTTTMEPVVLRDIPPSRLRLACSLCPARRGACIQCKVPTCTTAFHVSCAVAHDLRMELVGNPQCPEAEFDRQAYCRQHTRVGANTDSPRRRATVTTAVISGPGKRTPADTLHRTTREFCDFVDLPATCSIEEDAHVRAVFAYWVLKRRQYGGRPLVRQCAFTPGEVERGLHRHHAHAADREARALDTVRTALVAARRLCDMVQKREETKRALFNLMHDEFALSVKTFAESLELDLDDVTATPELNSRGIRRRIQNTKPS